MELEVENLRHCPVDPSPEEIALALHELDGFAILSHNELTYMHTTGTVEVGYAPEYQESSTGQHFACPNKISLDRVKAAFVSFASGDDRWRSTIRWERQIVRQWSRLQVSLLIVAWTLLCGTLAFICVKTQH